MTPQCWLEASGGARPGEGRVQTCLGRGPAKESSPPRPRERRDSSRQASMEDAFEAQRTRKGIAITI